jgi:uncharacterized protein
MTRIGLVSDTHGFFDDRLRLLFSGVEQILHAGDVGSELILSQLAEIAPTTAVLGNCDVDLALPVTKVVELAGLKVLLQHVVHIGQHSVELNHKIKCCEARIVVCGHSHRPLAHENNGVLFANPGYAGKPRFHMPRSVAILCVDKGIPAVEFLPLP